jgi:hypothetical protein
MEDIDVNASLRAEWSRTAPIPALAPVMRTVLPRNLDALKTDMDERG